MSENNGIRRFESVDVSKKRNNNNDIKIYENTNFQPCCGSLEIITDNNYGFLRALNSNFSTSASDIYVSPNLIRTYKLRNGDVIAGQMRIVSGNEKYNSLYEISTINDETPEEVQKRTPFEELIPIFPDKQMKLETVGSLFSTRIIDLFSPIGFGQRALIVAQPKSGKTILLKDIANGVTTNHKNAILRVLLIGERPEEVTDMQRSVKGEVIASTFDESPERQVKLSMLALEKSKREVEKGKDVVILMDSITRFTRACNIITPASGRVLSGGLEMTSLFFPKKFFGAARNIENGGSLTIIATALTETGSKMDDIIFEEFKGTGNMELQLDRNLANRRIFPAINVISSGTRREDLLLEKNVISKIELLRKLLIEQTQFTPVEFLINKMRVTRSNAEFLTIMNQ